MSEHEHSVQACPDRCAKRVLCQLFASGDGVHDFTNGRKASGIPNAEKEFSELIQSGLKVELCGTCLNFRGIKDGDISPGAERSTMKNLFTMVKESDVCVTLWA